MADNIVGIEGFEKYATNYQIRTLYEATLTGNLFSSVIVPLENQGFLQEWASTTGIVGLQPGLSGFGTALLVYANIGTSIVNRALPTNYARMIFGFAFMFNPSGSSGVYGIEFMDSATAQISIGVDYYGHINVVKGILSNTGANVLYTSDLVINANTRHYMEIDMTINNSTGAYQIWLDGVSLTSASSQNTRSSSNNFMNAFQLVHRNGPTGGDVNFIVFDDMYWRDNTNGTASPYGDCYVREMTPSADSSVAFTPNSAIGQYPQETTATQSAGVNQLILVPVTPTVNMTINSVSILPRATSAGAKLKGVIYSDNTATPGSLLSSGTEVIGTVNGTQLTLALTTPQALTGGTQYWIGYITDTSVAIQLRDNGDTRLAQTKANTYTLGAPAGPLSAMTTAQQTYVIVGLCTSAASNYATVNQNPSPLTLTTTQLGYNTSSTASQEDLFTHPSLPVTPTAIKAVKVSALVAKSDAGARTFSIRLKSNTNATNTDSAGTAGTALAPTTSPLYYSTFFETDPDGSAAWTAAGVNNSKIGYKVET